MPALRTQVYLTPEQRRRIDELVQAQGGTLAEIVRRALDAYLVSAGVDASSCLASTFGADPKAQHPDRDAWHRG